jgi:hypothetical protein
MAEKKKKSTTVNLTAFEILQAITGELPCHASPNGKESDKQKVQPEKRLLRLPKPGRV